MKVPQRNHQNPGVLNISISDPSCPQDVKMALWRRCRWNQTTAPGQG